MLRTAEVDIKLTRANNILTRISSIPKPKVKAPKRPKNFKLDNITINGMEGDNINIEDFIKYSDNTADEEVDNPEQQQQEPPNAEED